VLSFDTALVALGVAEDDDAVGVPLGLASDTIALELFGCSSDDELGAWCDELELAAVVSGALLVVGSGVHVLLVVVGATHCEVLEVVGSGFQVDEVVGATHTLVVVGGSGFHVLVGVGATHVEEVVGAGAGEPPSLTYDQSA
jgi:hypothetical protein